MADHPFDLRFPGPQHNRFRFAEIGLLMLLAGYAVAAYLVLPSIWFHYEHQRGLANMPMVTRTAQGIPGDPINVGLIGNEAEVLCAINAAGWYPADRVTLRSSIEIAGSVLLDRSYNDAPVSGLYYLGKHQDLAFEKPVGSSADQRHHVRLWNVLDAGQEMRPVWLGAATFDRGVGVSRYTGAVTHHIAADIDRERKTLIDDLEAAGMVDAKYQVSGVGPTMEGRNGGGDLYFTDGEVWIVRLVAACHKRSHPATVIASPAATEIKDDIFRGIANALKKLPAP